jgi:hypothetical protein
VNTSVFCDNSVNIDTSKKWLYFITGKPKNVLLDYSNISNIEIKTKFAIWDLLFAILFIFVFFLEFDIWWIILAALCAVCSFGKNIIISLQNNTEPIIIPADGIGSDNKLIKNISESIRKRSPNIHPENAETMVKNSKKTVILNALPFKSFVESKIPSEKIEGNATLKTVVQHTNIIAIGLIILILIFIGLGNSPVDRAIKDLEKTVAEMESIVKKSTNPNSDNTKLFAQLIGKQKKLEEIGRVFEEHEESITEKQQEKIAELLIRAVSSSY